MVAALGGAHLAGNSGERYPRFIGMSSVLKVVYMWYTTCGGQCFFIA